MLDSLPRNETFNFVDLVSIELTTQMLATLFDFPFEERRKLTRWSDVSTALPKGGVVESAEQRRAEMDECAAYFTKLWNERVNAEPRNDLISMMAHNDATRYMDPDNLMGNIILLIVGGNDTTRNTMSGSVLALNEHPEQYKKLRDNPDLIDTMVPEVIRWQTPLAHMRRTALVDTEIGGKKIRKGDRVVMWYVSGNRDEEVIERPNEFIIDRARPKIHLSFGFGIHRCVGMRLAELQLKIVWQEILKRFERIEVVGEPKRVYSSFVRGIESLPVRIPCLNDDAGTSPESRRSHQCQGFYGAPPVSASSTVWPGYPEVALPRRDDLLQFFGHFHGGVITALADQAAGIAVTSSLPKGRIGVTVELKINFMEPAHGNELIARAKTLKMSGSIGVATVEIFSKDEASRNPLRILHRHHARPRSSSRVQMTSTDHTTNMPTSATPSPSSARNSPANTGASSTARWPIRRPLSMR